MLQQGLGIGDLIRAAKHAYVQAAIAHVLPAGSRVNASRISVTTGLTRKEVSELVSQFEGRTEGRPRKSHDQRARRVLRGWAADPRFLNHKGQPVPLTMHGKPRSFQMLVKLYGGDVTPQAVLKELERMGAVKVNRSGQINLHSRGRHEQSIKTIEDLARCFADFANSIGHVDEKDPSVFFGFRESHVFSANQAARFHRTYSRRAAVLLGGVEQWLQSQKPGRQTNVENRRDKIRIGIGVYTVQQHFQRSQDADRSHSTRLKKRDLAHEAVPRHR